MTDMNEAVRMMQLGRITDAEAICLKLQKRASGQPLEALQVEVGAQAHGRHWPSVRQGALLSPD